MLQGGMLLFIPESCSVLGTAGYCRSHSGCAFHVGTKLSTPRAVLHQGGLCVQGMFSAATGHELLGQHRHTMVCAWHGDRRTMCCHR